MDKRVSKYFNVEKGEGRLIVHNQSVVFAEFVSPVSTLQEFNNWVKETMEYIYIK
ncbi:hypothetical protein [Shouchella tritolerans]|uniref:hypothetical protein n=1 Tax=Shouchella tritolerans TaxID=2979466 RepID=UPI0021E70C02|nr:hypothetical protein [Shouchella tritolerans]